MALPYALKAALTQTPQTPARHPTRESPLDHDAVMQFELIGAMCDVLKTCKLVYTAATDPQPAEIFAMKGGGLGNVFTQEYIDKNPQLIDALIRALKDADTFINNPANFDESMKIATQFFKFDMPKGDVQPDGGSARVVSVTKG